MSLLLRHRPEVAQLSLDAAGWVLLDQLVQAIRRQRGFGWVDEKTIRHVVDTSKKQRFEIAGTPPRIRATYGHSTPVEIEYERVMPPPTLYHGTTRRALPNIFREGLRPMQRHHVFLTKTTEGAEAVGRRRDPKPVILAVDTEGLMEEGHSVFRTSGGLYLTDYVPPNVLDVAS